MRYKRVDADANGITTTYYVGGKAYEKILKPDASLKTKHYIGDFAIITDGRDVPDRVCFDVDALCFYKKYLIGNLSLD